MRWSSRRRTRRRRRNVARPLLAALTPVFRYDHRREAHVLRLVGNRYGPVLRGAPRGNRRSLR